MAIKSRATLQSEITSTITNGGVLLASELRSLSGDWTDSLVSRLGDSITGALAITGALSFGTTLNSVTAVELSRLTGVTGAIQTQLNAKQATITTLGIANGGTGQATAQLAINALSQVSGATNEYVLTKDTGTGNATWKVAGGSGISGLTTGRLTKAGSPTTIVDSSWKEVSTTLAPAGASGSIGIDVTNLITNIFLDTTSVIKMPTGGSLAFNQFGTVRFNITSTGKLEVGAPSSTTEGLNLETGILIGNAIGTTNGTIRWTGTDFEGRKAGAWASLTSIGMAIGGSITSATAGSVLFAGASGVLQQDNANFFWDNTLKNFGLNTATPTAKLHVVGVSGLVTAKLLAGASSTVATLDVLDTAGTTSHFKVRNNGSVLISNVMEVKDFGGYLAFGYSGWTNLTYAMQQSSGGKTYINAATGEDINFSINNSNISIFNSTKATFFGAVDISSVGGFLAIGYAGFTSSTYLLQQSPGGESYINAASGQNINFSINNAQKMRLSNDGNLGIGTSTFGTSAIGVLAMLNGTAPTTSPANTIQAYAESGIWKYRDSSGNIITI